MYYQLAMTGSLFQQYTHFWGHFFKIWKFDPPPWVPTNEVTIKFFAINFKRKSLRLALNAF